MSPELLLPDVAEVDGAEFWAATRRHELSVQACADCGVVRHPPRPMCPACTSTAASTTPVSGRGTVWSSVTAHSPLLPPYEAYAPYNVIVVELDDAPVRMVGNLVASDSEATPTMDHLAPQPPIGAAVRVVFDDVSADVTLPRWVLA